jgi:hypothetical protein
VFKKRKKTREKKETRREGKKMRKKNEKKNEKNENCFAKASEKNSFSELIADHRKITAFLKVKPRSEESGNEINFTCLKLAKFPFRSTCSRFYFVMLSIHFGFPISLL